MKSRALREHDRDRRRERRGMNLVRALQRRGWVSGFALAAFGLAAEGYTDYPSVETDEFSIRRTGAGPGS